MVCGRAESMAWASIQKVGLFCLSAGGGLGLNGAARARRGAAVPESPGLPGGDFAESVIPAQNHSPRWQVLVAQDLFQFSSATLSGKQTGVSGDLPIVSKTGRTFFFYA